MKSLKKSYALKDAVLMLTYFKRVVVAALNDMVRITIRPLLGLTMNPFMCKKEVRLADSGRK